MTRTIIDVHVLQTVPPSNINRDDTGAPKTAVYGGVRRSRVSSQAWKRATREAFPALLDPGELGVRTKKVVQLLADHITALSGSASLSQDQALELAAETLRTATGSKIEPPKRKSNEGSEDAKEAAPESSYLMFLSAHQLNSLAELALAGGGASGDVKALKEHLKKKDIKAAARHHVDTGHSVDIALFGRMVADAPDLKVDAATQVAHAISVHPVETESDYYTAVDDCNTDAESGAGMIGTIDFNSSTLYRYAAVDVDELAKNLGSGGHEDEGESAAQPVRRAVEAFLEAFTTSLPTGKIATFGNHTLPAVVLIKLRSKRPISFVGAFEEPVTQGEEGGYLHASCDQLARHIKDVEGAYGVADTDPAWVLRVGAATEALAPLGTEVSLDELVSGVGEAVAGRLESQE